MMAYRKSMGRAKSRRSFKKNTGVHPKNSVTASTPRGGIRL